MSPTWEKSVHIQLADLLAKIGALAAACVDAVLVASPDHDIVHVFLITHTFLPSTVKMGYLLQASCIQSLQ